MPSHAHSAHSGGLRRRRHRRDPARSLRGELQFRCPHLVRCRDHHVGGSPTGDGRLHHAAARQPLRVSGDRRRAGRSALHLPSGHRSDRPELPVGGARGRSCRLSRDRALVRERAGRRHPVRVATRRVLRRCAAGDPHRSGDVRRSHGGPREQHREQAREGVALHEVHRRRRQLGSVHRGRHGGRVVEGLGRRSLAGRRARPLHCEAVRGLARDRLCLGW